MEPSNLQHFSDDATSKETCRLRHGLNAHCLLTVFEYSCVSDLIEICKLDDYFKELTINWIVEKKVLNLGEVNFELDAATVEVFQTFGKSMRRLTIGGNNFELFLRLVVEYCEPNTLTEVNLLFYHDKLKEIDINIIYASMPFFSRLRKLRFWGKRMTLCTQFLMTISLTASNLEVLQLTDADIECGWLENMQNLRELRIYRSKNISLDDLTNCLMVNPKLKVFKFNGGQNIAAVGDALSKYCSGLKTFSDLHRRIPYDKFGVALINRYNFLSTFTDLNSLTITSYTFCGSDLYYPMSILGTTNIVKLKVYMAGCNKQSRLLSPIVLNTKQKEEIMRNSHPPFASLQTLEIEFAYSDEPKYVECDLRCEFVFHFVTQLKNLEVFKYKGFRLTNVYKILKFAPNIRTLCLSESNFVRPWCEIINILQYLRTRQESGDHQRLLHLVLADCDELDGFKGMKFGNLKELVHLEFIDVKEKQTINKC